LNDTKAQNGDYSNRRVVAKVRKEQETQLSLTNRATHLCNVRNGVADARWPPKTRPSPRVLPVAERGRSALKGVRISRREPQNWGSRRLRLLGMGGMADP